MKEKSNDLVGLEVLARMTNTKIEVRGIISKWLLLTYDIPCTEAGDRARREFLDQARLIGATKHTDSVYLMPHTKAAEHLALQLARAGEVCIWTSETMLPEKSQEITRDYDASLMPQLTEINTRMDKIEEHLNWKRNGRAAKMVEKTERMLLGIEQAIVRRGSESLFAVVTVLKARFDGLVAEL